MGTRKTSEGKYPLATVRINNNQELNETLQDLLREKKQFCVTYHEDEIVISYSTGPTFKR